MPGHTFKFFIVFYADTSVKFLSTDRYFQRTRELAVDQTLATRTE